MPTATPGLCLEYLPLAGGSARLIRLWGDTPCPVLPETVDGLPLTELGDYCFAEHQRESALPPAGAVRRCFTGSAPRPRYSFDDALPPERIGGRQLQSITLPAALRVVGSCAFFDCRSLTEISVGAGITAVGSDVFVNNFALHRLVVRAAPDTRTGLDTLLVTLQNEVRAAFCPGEAELAAAWFPEYWEDIEETPAHILLHSYSGQGYHYRQCFADGVLRWAEYDAVLSQSAAEDMPATLALLCLDRLRYAVALSEAAAAAYRAYLAAHTADAVKRLLKEQDADALRALAALDVWNSETLDEAAALAQKADSAEAAALFAQQQRARFAPKKKSYSFDEL